jgi:hypothetical protein
LRRRTLHAPTFTSWNYGGPEYVFTESCFKHVTKYFRMSLCSCVSFSCSSLQSITSCDDIWSNFHDMAVLICNMRTGRKHCILKVTDLIYVVKVL